MLLMVRSSFHGTKIVSKAHAMPHLRDVGQAPPTVAVSAVSLEADDSFDADSLLQAHFSGIDHKGVKS